MMGATAVWTAAHYRIPMLVVVCNNRSFFNDELHQERVARIRNRPVENRWIGQRISEPDIDCAAVAKAQGARVPAGQHAADLVPTFEKAIAAVEDGEVAVVDVRVEPGYAAMTTAAMLRGTRRSKRRHNTERGAEETEKIVTHLEFSPSLSRRPPRSMTAPAYAADISRSPRPTRQLGYAVAHLGDKAGIFKKHGSTSKSSTPRDRVKPCSR